MTPRRHLMDPWRDSLVMELRMRDVPGNRIGEVLAELDAHCADSGQTPEEAFGDPVAYAQEVIEVRPPTRPSFPRRILLPTGQAFATMTGVLSLLDGVDGVAHGNAAEVTAGEITAVLVGTLAFPVLATAVFQPAVFRRPAVQGLLVAVLPFLIVGAPLIFWRTPVAHAPAAAMLTVGLFLLAVAWWPAASNRFLADRIIDPRTGSEPFQPPRFAIAVVRWMLPAVLLVAVVTTILIP